MVSKVLRIRIVAIGMIYGFFHEGEFFTILYALPIDFQAVSDVSPAQAGVRNIPLLVSCGIESIAAGLLVSKYKHFVPLMVWASGGGCIGTGLLYMLDVTSPSSHWIGFQILAGLAFGTGLPLAIIAGQAHVTNEDLRSATAMLLSVIQAGATEIRASFAADTVPGIVETYLRGLRAVYVMVIVLTGVAALAATTNRWKKLSLEK
ncbi:hypothetical protein OEA41_005431 [Lepraria neglecta]|uniref:Uncharacterized protein n=1 Tax=Lepraria neglecta TaxID=209136 RepID=A0AAD9Z3S0_9LECA|nr:hypothetical protein OEA41_005431 [Lepraria neglecta]